MNIPIKANCMPLPGVNLETVTAEGQFNKIIEPYQQAQPIIFD
jgi:hypothetical protein